jgi:hypothetical protein
MPIPQRRERDVWEQELLTECPDRVRELERRIKEREPDFLIGLHLEDCLPEGADVEEISRVFTNALSVLPKRPGVHYKVNLSSLGLKGFANLYFVAPGTGSVFCYNHPLTAEESEKDKVCL